ncbi:metallophosphoesterase [Acholeplasma granularum]|uniref:metallophosphoesterase n=1 Tax=Acholeplasma granularum TaxID=264635 RepID=UPI000472543B|nr:metallophosphoesterase [Acholeplasma granularum]
MFKSIANKFNIIVLFFLVIILVSCNAKEVQFELVYGNGQIGIVSSYDDIKLNDEKLSVYKTTNEKVSIHFESQYLDDGYQNILLINENHPLELKRGGDYELFTKTKYEIISPNIINGSLTLNFISGTNAVGTYDNFFIRNIFIVINNEQIWSNEYSEDEYLNESLKMGNDDLRSEFRFGYQQNIQVTFDIPDKHLNRYGALLSNNEESFSFNANGKTYDITNQAYLKYDININDNEVINETKTITVTNDTNTKHQIYLDGIEIENNLKLTKGAWSNGEHKLNVVLYNDFGFKEIKEIEFELEATDLIENNHNYTAYNYGIISNLNIDFKSGKEVSLSDENPFLTPFGEYGMIGFEIDYNLDKLQFNYEGTSLPNRSIYLQIYNNENKVWQTVSTYITPNDALFNLGYDFSENSNQYNVENKVRFRVVSVNLEKLSTVSEYLYHLTDIQYITQKIAKAEDSSIGKAAIDALTKMQEYIIGETNNNKLIYSMMTGDFTQTLNNAEVEYEKVMQYLFNPLLENNIAFGVLSGNHDVGGVSENINGAQALDEDLIYEYWNANLGENVFSHNDFYKSNYDNNRSHHDRLNINGLNYSFLYLGWGSSIKGINVSILDINYAKTVLEQYPDDIFVLLSHNYMGGSGLRSSTGEYVYNLLVKTYPQIKLVISGHINGSSSRIDYLDDDNDGLYDRRVFQFLTNFQEEDSLYGASFIRRMGLDYENNRFVFDLYSPFYNSSDIYVASKHKIVNEHKLFKYDFDLSGNGFSLKSYGVK